MAVANLDNIPFNLKMIFFLQLQFLDKIAGYTLKWIKQPDPLACKGGSASHCHHPLGLYKPHALYILYVSRKVAICQSLYTCQPFAVINSLTHAVSFIPIFQRSYFKSSCLVPDMPQQLQ